MSLFRDSLRPPPLASDEAVRRYLMAIRAELEPDPLFTRRLRGLVMNRYVAVREGDLSLPARRRSASPMGRLGRACLYATVAVAMSVGGAMAAAQSALPGDPLYGLKRQIEELRMQVLPVEYRDELAAYALGQRVNELSRLTAAGESERAAALARDIGQAYAQLVQTDGGGGGGGLTSRIAVLEELLERLPDAARAAIQRALNDAPGLVRLPPAQAPDGATSNRQPVGAGADREPTSNGSNPSPEPPNPSASPVPHETTASPKPTPKPKPNTSPGQRGNSAETDSEDDSSSD